MDIRHCTWQWTWIAIRRLVTAGGPLSCRSPGYCLVLERMSWRAMTMEKPHEMLRLLIAGTRLSCMTTFPDTVGLNR